MTSSSPPDEPTPKMNMGVRREVIAEATKRVARHDSDDRVVRFLTNKGLDPLDAQAMLERIKKHVASRRLAAAAATRKKKAIPILIVMFGVFSICMALFAGNVRTLLSGSACVWVGYLCYERATSVSLYANIGPPRDIKSRHS